MRLRIKPCDRCTQPAPILYRVRTDESEEWVFVCDRCFPTISQNNPHYTYGGTWKARKRRG